LQFAVRANFWNVADKRAGEAVFLCWVLELIVDEVGLRGWLSPVVVSAMMFRLLILAGTALG
jgi:hypothetical protein